MSWKKIIQRILIPVAVAIAGAFGIHIAIQTDSAAGTQASQLELPFSKV